MIEEDNGYKEMKIMDQYAFPFATREYCIKGK